jgi:hypothetical protein
VTRVAPVQVARWALKAGWRTPNSQTAIAVGIAQGADPAKPGGVWGVGGPANDGQGQANAAFAQWKTQGWDEFPAWSSAAWRLYLPTAAAAQALANADALLDQGVDVATQPARDAAGAVLAPFQGAVDILDYLGTEEFWQRGIKIALGVGLLVIASVSIAWTTTTRPLFQAVGILDDKINQQLPLVEGGQQVIVVPKKGPVGSSASP